MQLTRMLSRPCEYARSYVSPMTPAFAGPYAPPPIPLMAAIDEMLTIAPPPAARRCGTALLLMSMTAVRSRRDDPVPHDLIRDSPSSAGTRDRSVVHQDVKTPEPPCDLLHGALTLRRTGDVGRDGDAGAAGVFDQLDRVHRAFRRDIDHAHPRAVQGEQRRNRDSGTGQRTTAPRPSDEGDTIRQPTARIPEARQFELDRHQTGNG